MLEALTNRIFLGNLETYEEIKENPAFSVVITAKEPFHRRFIGYQGRTCGKDHPEYLYVVRGNTIVLNLIDGDKPEWVSEEIINKALEFIDNAINNEGKKVLICCNQGISRSPAVALMYFRHTKVAPFGCMTYEEAEDFFRKTYYPYYRPAAGIRGYAIEHWDEL